MLMAIHILHPANVPGDFYVEDGCCTMCEVPFTVAPDLFGTCQDPKGYPHCFVKRQPDSPAELDQMISAIRYAELQCIRYRGSDRLIQLRLIEVDEGIICDGLPPDLQREADRREAARQKRWQEQQRAREIASGKRQAGHRPWWRFW
jgi:hypothetical protein